MNMGVALRNLGRYGDAIVTYEEALEICTTMSAQDPLQYNELIARTLYNFGLTHQQFFEAVAMEKQAISLYRNLAQTGEKYTTLLCDALHNYAHGCSSLGQHAEAALAYQDSIHLRRALAATDFGEERRLIVTLHCIAHCFLALDKHADVNAVASESLERNHGRVVERCRYAPDFQAYSVCQRGTIPDSPQNVSLPLPFVRAVSPHRGLSILDLTLPLPQPRPQSPLERW